MKQLVAHGTCQIGSIPDEITWVGLDGRERGYRLPQAIYWPLAQRLAAEFKLDHARIAARLAVLIVGSSGKWGGKPFPLDRRALALVDREDGFPRGVGEMIKAAGMTEWQARVGIYALEFVGFVERDADQAFDHQNHSMARFRRVAPRTGDRAVDRRNLRRAPILWRIGRDFLSALTDMIKRSFAKVVERVLPAEPVEAVAAVQGVEDAPENEEWPSEPVLPYTHFSSLALDQKEELLPRSGDLPAMGGVDPRSSSKPPAPAPRPVESTPVYDPDNGLPLRGHEASVERIKQARDPCRALEAARKREERKRRDGA